MSAEREERISTFMRQTGHRREHAERVVDSPGRIDPVPDGERVTTGSEPRRSLRWSPSLNAYLRDDYPAEPPHAEWVVEVVEPDRDERAEELFKWPKWWEDGHLGNREQLRELVHALHGRAVRAEMRAKDEHERTVKAVVEFCRGHTGWHGSACGHNWGDLIEAHFSASGGDNPS